MDRDSTVIYVENAGEFVVPRAAVKSVTNKKVIFDCGSLAPELRAATGHVHDAESEA